MSTQITNYQCPACTGPLRFDEQSGKLHCDYCESSFTVEEVEALFAQKNAQAEQQSAQEREPSEWGEDASQMRAYNCPSCGAEIVSDANTAATFCPYCDSPSIMPSRLSGSLRPDAVLPFRTPARSFSS